MRLPVCASRPAHTLFKLIGCLSATPTLGLNFLGWMSLACAQIWRVEWPKFGSPSFIQKLIEVWNFWTLWITKAILPKCKHFHPNCNSSSSAMPSKTMRKIRRLFAHTICIVVYRRSNARSMFEIRSFWLFLSLSL